MFLRFVFLFNMCCIGVSAQDVFNAARTGDTALLQKLYLLKHDTLESKNEAGFTPLILASYRGQINAVQFLVNKKVNLDTGSPEGPALLGASYNGHLKIAQILLQAGANVNVTNEEGFTALMYAVMKNNLEMTRLLMSWGASKDLLNSGGKSAASFISPLTFPDIRAMFAP